MINSATTKIVERAIEEAGVSPTLVRLRTRGWEKVREEGRCRMCLRPPSVRALTRHHLVPLSFFRDRPELSPLRNSDANIVGLCDPCHQSVETRDDHARVELRRLLGSSEVAFVIQVAGKWFLEARYPNRRGVILRDIQKDTRGGR